MRRSFSNIVCKSVSLDSPSILLGLICIHPCIANAHGCNPNFYDILYVYIKYIVGEKQIKLSKFYEKQNLNTKNKMNSIFPFI